MQNPLEATLENPIPTIAVTFDGRLTEPVGEEITAFVQVGELRADLAETSNREYLACQARKIGPLPVLLTIRSAQEGGRWQETEAKRLKLASGLATEKKPQTFT